MDDKLKDIIQKGIRATSLWLFSYILGFLRNFGIGRTAGLILLYL